MHLVIIKNLCSPYVCRDASCVMSCASCQPGGCSQWLVAARRLERNVKDVLEEIGDDKDRLRQLLKGKRVQLAEDLSTLTPTYLCTTIVIHYYACTPPWSYTAIHLHSHTMPYLYTTILLYLYMLNCHVYTPPLVISLHGRTPA